MVVTYTDLDGQVVVVDLVSDDEEPAQDNMETEIEVCFYQNDFR
jgi:hypothetical protein